MDRRDFMTRTGAAAALWAVGCDRSADSPKPLAPPSPRKVLVLGAGLAGLAAAYELKLSGFDVTVLEARDRVGGRVFTEREALGGGLYAEMGAEYIGKNDAFARDYARRLGLPLARAIPYDAVFVRGQRMSVEALKAGKKLPYEGAAIGKLFGHTKGATQALRKGVDPFKPTPEYLAHDAKSAAELMGELGLPKDLLTLFSLTTGTEYAAEPQAMSALDLLWEDAVGPTFDETTLEDRIEGGNSRLPEALYTNLAPNIRLKCEVVGLESTESEVRVTCREGGTQRVERASRVVLAVPFSIVRRWKVKWSDAKGRVINTLGYGDVLKSACACRERFWERSPDGDNQFPQGVGYRVLTDTPVRRMYHHQQLGEGTAGVLVGFTAGDDARKLGELDAEARNHEVRASARAVWPHGKGALGTVVTKYWSKDPWIRGGYSFLAVGQAADFLEIARQPEGRIHFAGEHTAENQATMDGAIASGVRAFREIQARVRL